MHQSFFCKNCQWGYIFGLMDFQMKSKWWVLFSKINYCKILNTCIRIILLSWGHHPQDFIFLIFHFLFLDLYIKHYMQELHFQVHILSKICVKMNPLQKNVFFSIHWTAREECCMQKQRMIISFSKFKVRLSLQSCSSLDDEISETLVPDLPNYGPQCHFNTFVAVLQLPRWWDIRDPGPRLPNYGPQCHFNTFVTVLQLPRWWDIRDPGPRLPNYGPRCHFNTFVTVLQLPGWWDIRDPGPRLPNYGPRCHFNTFVTVLQLPGWWDIRDPGPKLPNYEPQCHFNTFVTVLQLPGWWDIRDPGPRLPNYEPQCHFNTFVTVLQFPGWWDIRDPGPRSARLHCRSQYVAGFHTDGWGPAGTRQHEEDVLCLHYRRP